MGGEPESPLPGRGQTALRGATNTLQARHRTSATPPPVGYVIATRALRRTIGAGQARLQTTCPGTPRASSLDPAALHCPPCYDPDGDGLCGTPALGCTSPEMDTDDDGRCDNDIDNCLRRTTPISSTLTEMVLVTPATTA